VVVDRDFPSTTEEATMNKTRLTKRTVEALPVEKGKRAIVWDDKVSGFGVRATGAGRTYFVRYRVGSGRSAPRKDYSIGKHGAPWTVERAREEATRLLGQVAAGHDPQAVKVAKRTPDHDRSFEKVAETFIERHVDRNLKESTARDYRRIIRGTLVPKWTGRHITSIDRAAVLEVIDEIEDRAPVMARLTFAVARKLFGFAIERDLIRDNPCAGLSAPPPPKARDRVLSDDELRLVWLASEKLTFPYGHALRVLILTGQRRSEVSGMERVEVSTEQAEWVIPASKAKNGKAHAVDLSPQAIEQINAATDKLRPAPDKSPVGSFVFGVNGTHPPGQWGKAKAVLDTEVSKLAEAEEVDPPAPWRIHDLRRTAASGMAGMGFGPQVVERILNHVSGASGGLVGVYQRHDYRAERKAALEAWASKVEGLLRPMQDNVVRMERPDQMQKV
jgi:integrase